MFQTLIAEDNPVFREALKEVLARRFPFMTIEAADDGNRALDEGTATHHDLVFMDIKMPGRSGLEVTRAIKAGDREAIVCIVTSYDLPEYRQAARDCGADHFIVKDESTEAVIVGLVESILARRPKALIIEDDASFRGHLRGVLTQQCPTMIVAEAEDGPAGLDEAINLKPDLLLLNLNLPSSNGLDLVAAIKGEQALPVVAVITAYDLAEDRNTAASCGVTYFIAKDGDVAAALLDVVNRLFFENPHLRH